jgi:DNA-binding SARP family transcriptional activator/WD40 repeat protein
MGVSVLGAVSVDGAPRLAPREQIVLAVLALRNGEVTSTDTLADAIWGDGIPGTWPKQLQASIGVVRRAVGRDRIHTTPGGYRLRIEDEDLDLAQFEIQIGRGRMHLASGQAGRAVSEFRRSLALAPSDPFPALRGWSGAADEVERILELRRGVEDDLLRARLATGEHPTVAADAARAVAADPTREARWWALALAQYRSGRQGDALVTLRRVRALLASELGADPGIELQTLEKAILRQDPELLVITLTHDDDEQSPYPGLAPFGIEDAGNFFGREADVAATVEQLTREGFCVLSGPSGCGKSSLLRAGVAPVFQGRGDTVTITTPARALPYLGDGLNPRHLLVVDQFEEAFVPGAPMAVASYCAGVAELVGKGHRVAIAVRSDLLDACATQAAIAPLVAAGLQILTSPSRKALTAAIEEPARRSGLSFESGLADLMVSDTLAHPGGLPLLAHALAETWARREGSTMTLEAYRSAGGLGGSVSRTAEQFYLSLTEADRQSCRLLLLRLVSITAADSIVHRPLPLRALIGDMELESIVGRLAAARLLIVETDLVSLSHEAISRAWPRLKNWLEANRDTQRLLEHLSRAAVGWVESGESDDELYRGARLATARERLEDASEELTRAESRFLTASIGAADRDGDERAERALAASRQNVRLRRLLRTIAAVLGVAIIAGILAVYGALEASHRSEESQQAQQEAQLEAIVGQSSALRSSARDLATLLAVEAYRRWPEDARARSALFSVFSTEPGFLGYQQMSGVDRLSAAALPDGSGAVVLLADGTVAPFDFERSAMGAPFGSAVDGASTPGKPVVLSSADGARIVVAVPGVGAACGQAARCTFVSTFDATKGTRLLPPTAIAATGTRLAVDPTGDVAALTHVDTGQVAIVDLSTGRIREWLESQPGTESLPSVAFSAAGSLLVGTSDGLLRVIDGGTGIVTGAIQAPPGTVDVGLVDAGGGRVVASGNEGITAVDLNSRSVAWSTLFTDSHPEPCPWLAASSLSGTAYCGDRFGTIVERSMVDGALTGDRFDPQRGDVGDLAVSADGRILVAIGATEPVITRWRLDGSGPVTELIAAGQVTLDRYDPAGARLVTARRTPESRTFDQFSDFSIWDADADELAQQLGQLEGAGWVAADVVAAYIPAEDAIGYVDTATGEHIAGAKIPLDALLLWPGASGDRFHVLFPDGSIWTIATATMERIEPTLHVVGEPRSISSNTTGRVLVSSSTPDGPVMTLLDGHTGEVLIDAVPGGDTSVLAPDGTVFGSSARGQITHYDSQLRALRTLAGARGEISTLQISNDGRVLLAGGNDQTISVYDTATGIRFGTPLPADAPFIMPGVLRPDGMAIAVNSSDGILVWDLDTSHQIDEACRLAGRNLTTSEWETYLSGLGERRDSCPEFD